MVVRRASVLGLFLCSAVCLALRAHELREDMRFTPTQGSGCFMSATVPTSICEGSYYTSSPLERQFLEAADSLTDNGRLCSSLGQRGGAWVRQILGTEVADAGIFSKLCRKGQPEQLIEPLAGILRDPRFPCDGNSAALEFSIDWLLMADSSSAPVPHGARRRFFDAGGTHFTDAMQFFATVYQRRGITFDEVYVWEAVPSTYEAYWHGVDAQTRAFWEPRVTFYNGVPVAAERGHEHNVVERIHRICGAQDFCAFKLDIDTPSVELPLVNQLLASPAQTSASLDEFFFEHHVHGMMQNYGWGSAVNGTFADSYAIFQRLRQMGVRAHSWI